MMMVTRTAWATPPQAPRVVAIGAYAAAYESLYRHAGCDFQVMSSEKFQALNDWSEYDLIHLAHWDNIPPEVMEKLRQYQQKGGRLLFTLGSIPDRKFFGTQRPVTAQKGWTGDLQNDPSGFPEAGKNTTVYPYRRWGLALEGVAQLPQVSVLAYWVTPKEKSVNVDAPFRGKVPAILYINPPPGAGHVFYAGAYLASPQCSDIFYGIIHRIFPETDVYYDLVANFRAFSPQPSIPEKVGDRVAIAWEAGFPAAGLPTDVTPEYIRDTLMRSGISAELLSFAEVEAGLPVERYGALVLPYGENMPVECYKGIGRYIAAGGGLVNAAGLPLARPMRRTEGGWREIGDGNLTAQICYLVYQRLLPVGKYFTTPAGSRRLVNLNREWLPNLPAVWEVASGEGHAILPWAEYTYSCQMNLLAAADDAGEIGSYALTFPLFNSRYPYSPMVFCTLTGEGHPWSAKAHKWAPGAIADMVRLALRRDYVYITDLSTQLAAYHPGEPVKIIGEVRAMQPQTVALTIRVFPKFSDQVIFSKKLEVRVVPGKGGNFQEEFILPADAKGAYDISVTAVTPTMKAPLAKAMFYTFTPDEAIRNIAGWQDGLPTLNQQPLRLSGVNIYSNERRSPGVFFRGDKSRHLPQVWDRDMNLVRLAGGNAVRQHYLEEMLNETNFAQNGDSAPERIWEAFMRLADDNELLVSLAPMTFVPSFYKSWRDRLGTVGTPYSDKKWFDAVMRYYEQLGKRSRNFRNLYWEVINEPEFNTPAGTSGQSAENIRFWVAEGAKRLRPNGDAVGIGNITCDISTLWNSHENLRDVISWNHLHSYSADEVRPGGVKSTAYSLNFGRPAIIGEIGMPNSESSLQAQLGDWGEFYERTLALLIGERGIGFLNFYLANRMQGNDPEWGLLRGDLTEKEEFKIWKLWNIVNAELPPDLYAPESAGMVYFQADRDADLTVINGLMRDKYISSVRAGLHPQLLEDAEVATRLGHLRRIWILHSEASAAQAEKRQKEWSKAGIQVELIPLKADWAPAVENVARPIADFDYTYELPKKGGGFTWVLIGALKSKIEFHAGKYDFYCDVKPGSSMILDFDSEDGLRLMQMHGSCSIDRRTIVESNQRWLLWGAGDGSLPDAGAKVWLWADDPMAVRATVALAEPLPAKCRVYIDGENAEELAPLVALPFEHRGWRLTDDITQADYVIRLIAADRNSAFGKVRPDGTLEIAWGDGKRLPDGAAALLKVQSQSAEIYAAGNSARYLALLRLASLRQCGMYTVSPFSRQ